MPLFKCKMCGGSLEIGDKQSVAVCEYCGTKQTLPRLEDDRRANLYDRANHFRRNNDFDKAMAIYENILNEDSADAEAYWSLVLCRYGIEYVEDPTSHKRVPTVNRAQFTSVFDDEDYKSAVANADPHQKELFEAEAHAINEIQKGILSISQKEKPFDIFICYKESDANGRRTMDSVLATELYHELTREGFKVFFSRITLEDKLGVAYEPYIFAALHSAKVMVVLGTRSEHFNAVWVKNEWSRYLALIKNGAKKTLVPAYKDMDPYDLPEEFSHLQALDMSKLGFMQDLVHGIRKIVKANEPKQPASPKEEASAAAPLNTAPLLRRAFLFLETGAFERADDFCEQVLNQDPENAEAYLVKLMAEMQVKSKAELANCPSPFNENDNYRMLWRFSDDKLKAEMSAYIEQIKDRNERERLQAVYEKADTVLNTSKNWDGTKKELEALQKAQEAFLSLKDWQDSAEKAALCEQRQAELRQKTEEKMRQAELELLELKKREKRDLIFLLICSGAFALFIAAVLIISTIAQGSNYDKALELIEAGKYTEAIALFEEDPSYEQSAEMIKECHYLSALILMDEKQYNAATLKFADLGQYKDSATMIKECTYLTGLSLMAEGEYSLALIDFES